MRIVRQVIVLAAEVLLVSCSTGRSRALHAFAENPNTMESMSAGNFLLKLHGQSHLPGYPGDVQEQMRSERVPLPLPAQVTYPFSQTFLVYVPGQTFTNHYTIERLTKDSPWQLRKAWRTDSAGHTVKEWAIE